MANNLVVAVLGNRDSGKSSTWNAVFGVSEDGGTVRTGKYQRHLYLNKAEWVDVFLVSGSAEERETPINKILPKQLPPIVLCSMQYRADVAQTIDFFVAQQYDICVYWLNPGYHDDSQYSDELEITGYLLKKGAVIAQRSGKGSLSSRSLEIKQYIYGWAKVRNLITTDFE